MSSSPVRLRVAAGTDVGYIRTNNEDLWAADERVAVVADGMGGLAAGEVASQLAVAAFTAAAAEDRSAAGLTAAVRAAHAAVVARSGADRSCENMGTTLCALAVTDDAGPLLVNVGDSRAYGIDGSDAVLLTRDDTWVFGEVAEGRMTPAEAATDHRRNMLIHAIGLSLPEQVHTIRPARWPARVVLATDGLSDMLPAAAIGQLAATHIAPRAAVDALVTAALGAGGRDNVTVVVVDLLPDLVTAAG